MGSSLCCVPPAPLPPAEFREHLQAPSPFPCRDSQAEAREEPAVPFKGEAEKGLPGLRCGESHPPQCPASQPRERGRPAGAALPTLPGPAEQRPHPCPPGSQQPRCVAVKASCPRAAAVGPPPAVLVGRKAACGHPQARGEVSATVPLRPACHTDPSAAEPGKEHLWLLGHQGHPIPCELSLESLPVRAASSPVDGASATPARPQLGLSLGDRHAPLLLPASASLRGLLD